MKNIIKICCLGILLLAENHLIRAQSGTICGDPAQKRCVGQYDGFEPQDLVFNTGRAELGTGTRHESDEFYAVILESVPARKAKGDGCNFVSEAKRQAAQKLFPHNKYEQIFFRKNRIPNFVATRGRKRRAAPVRLRSDKIRIAR